MTTNHEVITDPYIHEPKGASTAASGQVYVSDGLGSGSFQDIPRETLVGFFDYNDLATVTAPINIIGGAGYTDITNDGQGPFTNKNYAPLGISDVWDASANKFDWSELQLGDMVDIRLDMQITTTSANQEYEVILEMNTDGASYQIPFAKSLIKTAGSAEINRYNGVYMGDLGTLNGKSRFRIRSDGNASLLVRGWYCKVLINR